MHIKDYFGYIKGIAGLGLSLLAGTAFGQYASVMATEEYVNKKVGSATNLIWKAVETNRAEIVVLRTDTTRAIDMADIAQDRANDAIDRADNAQVAADKAQQRANDALVLADDARNRADIAQVAADNTAHNLSVNYYTKAQTDAEVEKSLLFAQYYPDGSVKSAAEFTQGIKYDDPDTVNRTITVKPFCNTGDSENDNSSLVGRVVIPPFVDAQGNGYITDDGTRYKVVGVSDGSLHGGNAHLTAFVAPITVTNIGRWAFSGCTSLASVSLPAAETVGDYAFRECATLATVSLLAATNVREGAFDSCPGLTSVDFGDAPRSSVPLLGAYAFDSGPTTCKIIVPDDQYDAWIAAPNWSTLYADGYKFLRHSEWEYARRYELAAKQDALSQQQIDNIAAVPNKASITNTTLRGVYTYSDWVITSSTHGEPSDYDIEWGNAGGREGWVCKLKSSGASIAPAEGDRESTSLTWMPGGSLVVTGERTILSQGGFRLGPDDESNPNRDKILAAETEVQALVTAMDDKSFIRDGNTTVSAVNGGKATITTVEGVASVDFGEGFSISYNGIAYASPTGGESVAFYGPIRSTAVPQLKFWVPWEYRDATNFSESAECWYLSCPFDESMPIFLIYAGGPGYAIGDWNSEPTLAIEVGTATGTPPVMERQSGGEIVEIVTEKDVVEPSSSASAGQAAEAVAVWEQTQLNGQWSYEGLPSGWSVVAPPQYVAPVWHLEVNTGGENKSFYSDEFLDKARKISFTHYDYPGVTITATLNGYNLGGQSTKTLASEAEAVELRTTIAATATAATNYTDEALLNAITPSNLTFSNAVLSVGIGIDTNTVAAINALVEQGEELPIGSATTVGALLLALAAAVVALRRAKVNSTSVAPDFSNESTYAVGDYVTYLGVLYKCVVAKTAPSSTTPDNDIYNETTAPTNHWIVTDTTSPDAMLDITSAGSLRVVAADGTILWQQGYQLASASSATLANETFNLFTFAAVPAFNTTASYAIGDTVAYNGIAYTFITAHTAGVWIGTDAVLAAQVFSLPVVPSGKVGDFVLQLDNTANTASCKVDIAEYISMTVNMVVPKGRDIDNMFTIAGGERCELYFTQTAFAVGGKMTWKVMRMDVEAAS